MSEVAARPDILTLYREWQEDLIRFGECDHTRDQFCGLVRLLPGRPMPWDTDDVERELELLHRRAFDNNPAPARVTVMVGSPITD